MPSTLVAWLTRRAAELGGLLLAAEQVAPGTTQELLRTAGMLLTGRWEEVSLGAVFGPVSVIGGLIWNARSTLASRVVAPHGRTGSHARGGTVSAIRAWLWISSSNFVI